MSHTLQVVISVAVVAVFVGAFLLLRKQSNKAKADNTGVFVGTPPGGPDTTNPLPQDNPPAAGNP